MNKIFYYFVSLGLILSISFGMIALVMYLDGSMQVKAKSPPVVVCEPWAQTKQWTLDKCHDENDDIVCMVLSSGMEQCKFDQ